MSEEIKKFGKLINGAKSILVTSHISPDPDAVCSLLLMGTALSRNYPDKRISMVLEDEPLGLDSLAGYKDILFEPVKHAVELIKPDLVILLDGNNFERVSRHDGAKVSELVKQQNISAAIIDHHEPADKYESDAYINQGSPATAQDVYEVLFDHLGLKKPAGYAQTTLLGIYSDTNGFAYANPRHSDTLGLADRMISAGADIEKINNEVRQYTEDDIRVFGELAKNLTHDADYTYSFLSDHFISEWVKSGRKATEMHSGTDVFKNDFIRNIGGRKWGFVVYKDLLQGDNTYSVSFRSVADAKDVSEIARRLGGGGHKPAAGAKFEARSILEAIDKVQQAIETV